MREGGGGEECLEECLEECFAKTGGPGGGGEGVLSGDLNDHLTSLISVFQQSNLCVRLTLIIDLCICN